MLVFIFFYSILHLVCVCVQVYVCYGMHVEVRRELVDPFFHMGLNLGCQVWSTGLYPLSYLTGPSDLFLKRELQMVSVMKTNQLCIKG